MVDYPGAIKTFLPLVDGQDKYLAQHQNDRADEITAIQTLIGVLTGGQSYSESLKNLLRNYRQGCMLKYKSAADIYIEAGEIAIPDASGNMRWRRNASDLTVDWGDIDTGAEAGTTTYYVYAVADASGSEFTALISTNATTPTGATFYRKVGSFYNDGSSNIDVDSIVKSTNIAIITGTVAHGATIPLPTGFSAEQCRWFVSINNTSVWDGAGDYQTDITCSVNSSRVVTVNTTGGEYNFETDANYIIIGIK